MLDGFCFRWGLNDYETMGHWKKSKVRIIKLKVWKCFLFERWEWDDDV